jgi:hypothetical protein
VDSITVQEYVDLRASVGWQSPAPDLVARALAESIGVVTERDSDGVPIGLATRMGHICATSPATISEIANVPNLNDYARICHEANQQWWIDPHTGEPLQRNKGELIALMHSELSEMLEGIRRNTDDEHLPQFRAEEVELVDLLIRAFDYAGAYGFDIDTIWREKLAYNAERADHKAEARAAQHGKKF